MDRTFRDEEVKRVNRKAIEKTVLLDGLAREYTLSEIAILTRAGPARMLGLAAKGHLGLGADANITVYDEHDDKEQMFATPRYVIKEGTIIVEEGQLRADHAGRTLHVAPAYDPAIEQVIRPFFDAYYTIEFENYPVSMDYLPHHEVIATGEQRTKNQEQDAKSREHREQRTKNQEQDAKNEQPSTGN